MAFSSPLHNFLSHRDTEAVKSCPRENQRDHALKEKKKKSDVKNIQVFLKS